MDYYKKKLYLAQVDKKDQIIGEIERWQAHKKGVLHRGLTVALFFKGKVILQQRKHPVFDSCFDLTCSSHPYFIGQKIQTNLEAVYETLKREWSFKEQDLLSKPEERGAIIYQAKDPKSSFVEHEFLHFFVGRVTRLPSFNPQFAYGVSLLEKERIKDSRLPLAPWVKKLIYLL